VIGLTLKKVPSGDFLGAGNNVAQHLAPTLYNFCFQGEGSGAAALGDYMGSAQGRSDAGQRLPDFAVNAQLCSGESNAIIFASFESFDILIFALLSLSHR
jgi:hypothetical protein